MNYLHVHHTITIVSIPINTELISVKFPTGTAYHNKELKWAKKLHWRLAKHGVNVWFRIFYDLPEMTTNA